MGQMLEDFGEKRENIILSEMGETTKWRRVGVPLPRRLHLPTPSPYPKLAFARWPGRAGRDDDFSLKQKGDQITLVRSYTKMAAIFPSIRSRRVMVSY
jgi:hypothetical protein